MGQLVSSCCGYSADMDGEKESLNPTNIVPKPVIEREEEFPDSEERSGFRVFLFLWHEQHGYLLLQAVKRRKGGIHYQLPGGHVDKAELYKLGLDKACLQAGTRELYEETGIDLRRFYKRLELCRLSDGSNLYKKRRYYRVVITDKDAPTQDKVGPGKYVTAFSGESFQLRLSFEHTGFVFEKDWKAAADAIIAHSGGKNSYAFQDIEGRRAVNQTQIQTQIQA